MVEDGLTFRRWKPAPLEVPKEEERVQLPTAEALEGIHQQAHQEGYETGFAEGKAEGYRQGRAQAEEELRRLHELLLSVEQAVAQFAHSTSEELLNLALEISRQMLRQALQVRPELLLPVVRNIMESLPQNTQHPHLHLHPEDAALVRTHMHTEMTMGAWRVVEDQRIERGGCRIETATTTIDATLEKRWQRIANALGRDLSWLEGDGEHQ